MNARVAVAVAAVLALDGCAVGIASVRMPKRLPADGLPPLAQRLSFDLCMGPGQRGYMGILFREALSRAGVQADLVSEPGEPARFTITQRDREYEHEWSMILSMLTFSIIPGYMTERYNIEVDIALHHPAKGKGREHLVYVRGVDAFIWAPLIVHPDFIGSINGGWESAKYKEIYKNVANTGFDETILRLAADLRIRFGREGPEGPSTAVVGVTCPLPGGP